MRKIITLFCLLLLQFAGLLLFLKGFFPLKKALPGSATFRDLPPEPGGTEEGHRVPAIFDRLVFVLIDALRADFVFNDTRMAYTRRLIENKESFSFIAAAHSPTVTMPRVKAITTGGIPSFIDFIFNSVSTALQEDNLLGQLVTAGKKIVFFGDDTWLKLFPGHFWRSDGTTSFFVSDYTEVDNNVTRHLDKELQSIDWDVMVLHYLGLDHIGHLAGPSSPLVGPKLQEMDDIIKKIHQSLLKSDHKRGTKSLLMICGDHGMSESGSHGGASLPETLTPLVLLSSYFNNGRGIKFSELKVDQIDITSTLAMILGLPVPQNSVGHVIPEILKLYSPREKLRALQINAKQLLKVLQANGHNAKHSWELEEAYQLHQKWLEALKEQKHDKEILAIQAELVAKQYMKAITDMSSKIAASLSCYDLHAMISGIAILGQVFGWLVVRKLCHDEVEPRKMSFLGSLSLSSSLLFTFGVCFMVVVSVHLSICSSMFSTGACSSEILCSKQSSSIIFSFITIICSSLTLGSFIWNIDTVPSFLRTLAQHSRSVMLCTNKSLLIAGTCLHVISLLTSSFVEEEHQTWYFLVKTYCVVSFCASVKRYFKQRHQVSNLRTPLEFNEDRFTDEIKSYSSNDALENHCNKHKSRTFAQQAINFIEQKNTQRYISQQKSVYSKDETLFSLLGPLVCLGLVRLSRTWNQTGIKWVHLPDVEDWLTSPENKLSLSIISIASLCVIVFCTFKRTDTLTSLIQAVGLLFVYIYRVATGTVWLPLTMNRPIAQGLTEARLAYGCFLVLLVVSLVRFLKTLNYKRISQDNDHFAVYKSMLERAVQSFCAGFLIVVGLVTRAHSLFILAVFAVQHVCLDKYFTSSQIKVNSWPTYLVYLWFGQAAYFTLGKSNSLTTVDLAAGYIGLQEHNDVAVAVLLTLSTYSGPLLWMTALVQLVVKNTTSKKHLYDCLYDVCVTYSLPQSLLLTVYGTVVYGQRYHLFVWSVFSPKLIFDTVKTLVMLICITVVLVICALIGRDRTVQLVDKKE